MVGQGDVATTHPQTAHRSYEATFHPPILPRLAAQRTGLPTLEGRRPGAGRGLIVGRGRTRLDQQDVRTTHLRPDSARGSPSVARRAGPRRRGPADSQSGPSKGTLPGAATPAQGPSNPRPARHPSGTGIRAPHPSAPIQPPRRRSAVHRDGASDRPGPRRAARRPRPPRPGRRPGDARPARPGAGGGPRCGGGPPRRQAGQRLRVHRRPAQAARLRGGQAAGHALGRRAHRHRRRRGPRPTWPPSSARASASGRWWTSTRWECWPSAC